MEQKSKVNKVTTENVKVVVNDVKPQITYVKRKVCKFLKDNKLAAKDNTPTKPSAIKLTADQDKQVQGIIKKSLVEVADKYSHTTKPQMEYVKNHLNVHTQRYLHQ